jgi:hypothetical protein
MGCALRPSIQPNSASAWQEDCHAGLAFAAIRLIRRQYADPPYPPRRITGTRRAGHRKQRPHCLAGLRGFELPEGDSSSSRSSAGERPTTLDISRQIRQRFQLDGPNAICRFESSQPSQAVRPLRCDFLACKNRRHCGGLGWCARVSVLTLLESRDRVLWPATEDDDYSAHTSPGRNVRKRSVEMPTSFKASASATSGASIGSSVSWNVP